MVANKKNNIPKVTVVTINFNNYNDLKKTIDSVKDQTYDNFEYLIIDGHSSDQELALLNSLESNIKVLIEEDYGIYHAMNKAVDMAKGDWLLFMNSGDIFANNDSLKLAISKSNEDADVIYSDWIYGNSNKYVNASKKKMKVIHQSIIYRKSLHKIYGTYVMSENITISDYIFFLSIEQVNWVYTKTALSICDNQGISSKVSHFYQKISVDYMFKRISKMRFLIILSFYPFYKVLKNLYLFLVNKNNNKDAS